MPHYTLWRDSGSRVSVKIYMLKTTFMLNICGSDGWKKKNNNLPRNFIFNLRKKKFDCLVGFRNKISRLHFSFSSFSHATFTFSHWRTSHALRKENHSSPSSWQGFFLSFGRMSNVKITFFYDVENCSILFFSEPLKCFSCICYGFLGRCVCTDTVVLLEQIIDLLCKWKHEKKKVFVAVGRIWRVEKMTNMSIKTIGYRLEHT